MKKVIIIERYLKHAKGDVVEVRDQDAVLLIKRGWVKEYDKERAAKEAVKAAEKAAREAEKAEKEKQKAEEKAKKEAEKAAKAAGK